jgi:hypothetical protein
VNEILIFSVLRGYLAKNLSLEFPSCIVIKIPKTNWEYRRHEKTSFFDLHVIFCTSNFIFLKEFDFDL